MQFKVCLVKQLLNTTNIFELWVSGSSDQKYLLNVNSAILDSSENTTLVHTIQISNKASKPKDAKEDSKYLSNVNSATLDSSENTHTNQICRG